MPTGSNNAEGLTDTTVPTTGNTGGASGTAASTVTIQSPDVVTASNAHPAHGTMGYKFALSAAPAAPSRIFWAAVETYRLVFSFYVYVDETSISAIEDIGAIRGSANMGVLIIGVDGKAAMQNTSGTAIAASKATNVFPLQQMVRVDMCAAKGTGTTDGTLGYAYYLGENIIPEFSWESNAQNAGTANTATVYVGRSAARTVANDIYYDTIRWNSQTYGFMLPNIYTSKPILTQSGSTLILESGSASIMQY